ncbi:MAG: hypothetical protein KIS95_07450 [Anaerolineae bacterium]|uniref:hypothetical protein n=1 Tax=Promineifilum sp. TaxID=2664178 RepID=UPI001D1F659F|nr:hypothetical protein [Anaerolineales bacterium]MCB8934545.1 hypothetical protein [Promineifilum sp.]MCO5179885.1 hypothetical protein [Promineifilum sp.]MCW5847045.1 hypothetical protein [Anaerolineae bacterium]
MSDEKPIIDQLKDEERIKIDIPVEEDAAGAKAGTTDVVEEFKRLGRQFADTLEGIFNSAEARRMETEVRAGMKSFADEVEKVFNQAKESPAASRVKEEAVDVKERVETGEIGRKAQEGMVGGLRWLSTELEKLANQFTPADKDEPVAEKSPTE